MVTAIALCGPFVKGQQQQTRESSFAHALRRRKYMKKYDDRVGAKEFFADTTRRMSEERQSHGV